MVTLLYVLLKQPMLEDLEVIGIDLLYYLH